MHAKFLAWCAARGISTPLTLLGSPSDPSYRYLAAPADSDSDSDGGGIAAGADLVRVPLEACLIDDSLENLAERVAREKARGRDSEFAPYLEVLPGPDSPSLRAMPRFWPAERLETVADGGWLEARVREDERPRVDPWGLAIVNSRSNVLPGSLFSVTPLLDMFNHDPAVGTKARVTEEDELRLTIDKSFPAGEEVFISYDRLTNLDTLVNYGFVSPSNPCNAENVSVRTIRRPPVPLVVEADGSISGAALAPLREFLASPEEADRARGGGGGDDGRREAEADSMLAFAVPASDRNEEEVTALVAAAVDDAACEAEGGAEAAGDDDPLVAAYLTGRSRTLKRALDKIGEKFPDLGY